MAAGKLKKYWTTLEGELKIRERSSFGCCIKPSVCLENCGQSWSSYLKKDGVELEKE